MLSPWQTLLGASSALSGKTLEVNVVLWKEHRPEGSRGCVLPREGPFSGPLPTCN